jgi:hypothetical protein
MKFVLLQISSDDELTLRHYITALNSLFHHLVSFYALLAVERPGHQLLHALYNVQHAHYGQGDCPIFLVSLINSTRDCVTIQKDKICVAAIFGSEFFSSADFLRVRVRVSKFSQCVKINKTSRSETN